MQNARSFMLSMQQFGRISELHPSTIDHPNEDALKLIEKAIKCMHVESGIAPSIRIHISDRISNGKYSHQADIIYVPYKYNYTDIDYYLIWRHEAEHAHQQQIRDSSPSKEGTMLNISRFLYPAEVERENGTPKDEYLYNYAELRARTAEANALREALEERYNATPRDFWRTEKAAYLKCVERFLENSSLQHNKARCRNYINGQGLSILTIDDPENDLHGQGRLQALAFWNTIGRFKIHQAFREFCKARQALQPLYEQLRQDVQNISQETLDELQMREQVGRENYQEMHQTLQNLMPVLSVSELQQPLPVDAICVRGTDNMKQFLEEYKELLDTFSVCEEFDTNSHESLYVVFATKDFTPHVQAQIEAIPSPYEPETLSLLDEIDKTVELDEFSPEELI